MLGWVSGAWVRERGGRLFSFGELLEEQRINSAIDTVDPPSIRSIRLVRLVSSCPLTFNGVFGTLARRKNATPRPGAVGTSGEGTSYGHQTLWVRTLTLDISSVRVRGRLRMSSSPLP